MRRLFLVLAFLLFFFAPAIAFADEGWIIDNFDSALLLKPDGEVAVTEQINVDFRNLSKHGIYRDIPYIYQDKNSAAKTYTDIDIDQILQNDAPEQYTTSRQDGYIRIKIGNPDRTISGKQHYTLHYRAKGVLRSFADHDELYWNATGNNWPVTIASATAAVILPKDGLQQVACYEGYIGSQGECHAAIESGNVGRFAATDVLDEDRGMTIVAGYTKGMVPILTVARPKSFIERFVELPSLVTLAIVLAAGVGTVLYFWYKSGRDYWFASNLFGTKKDTGTPKPLGGHETVVVEYTSPEDLRPAELGVLIDERADTLDIVSTIIDLASRGFLSITEIPKKWVFSKVDYQLTKETKDASKLLSYEKLLLDRLFVSGTTVTLSELKNTFYTDLLDVKKELYKEVVAKGLFPSNPETIRQTYLGIGTFIAFGMGFLAIAISSAAWIFITDVCIGIACSGLALMAMSFFMPRRTAYGRDMYRRARGYLLFINTAEKYRQRFFEKKNMFNEVLPYAIMFGITEKFARQMHDIGIKPQQPGWYHGTSTFNAVNFGNNINGFSSSLSSAMASTPSGKSGFSGGSSGGGFGGGGGGSW